MRPGAATTAMTFRMTCYGSTLCLTLRFCLTPGKSEIGNQVPANTYPISGLHGTLALQGVIPQKKGQKIIHIGVVLIVVKVQKNYRHCNVG